MGDLISPQFVGLTAEEDLFDVSVEQLEFSYGGQGQTIFCGLSHTFERGTITVVAGRSGRGKSTLLYVLGLMLTPVGGCVRFGPRVVSQFSDGERSRIRAQRIGFVFQDSALDPVRPVIDSVVEPALYAGVSRRWAEPRARSLLAGLNVDVRPERLPGQVSGGQAQRIAIARAFLLSPSIVLADEPTGNLDAENSEVVLAALRAAATKGATVVVASHDPAVLNSADSVLSL